jgi:hypothetical protein
MSKALFGYEQDNTQTGIIFRTTERPIYLEQSFPSVVERTSPEATIIVLNNCRDPKILNENRAIVDKYSDDRVLYFEYPRLLGVPGSVNGGVNLHIQHCPSVRRVFICDDDCIAPEPKEGIYWDEVLGVMLSAGWKVVGHPNRVNWYKKSTLRELNGIKGHVEGHLAGAYAGFKISDWKQVGGMPSSHPLYGFGPYCHLFHGMCAYWPGDPKFLAEDMDRDTNPKSLRKSKYFKWYQYVRPAQAKHIEQDVPDEFK